MGESPAENRKVPVPVWAPVYAALIPLLAVAGGIASVFHIAPPPCVFFKITGYPCPTCGMTRAAFCLAEGNFAESLAWNPLLLPALAATFLFWSWCVLIAVRKLPPPVGNRRKPLVFAVRAIPVFLLINWLYLLGLFGPHWPGR